MSNRKKQPLPDDAERLFREIAKREAEHHECTRDLTPGFMRELGFRTADAVKTAADQVSLYAPEGKRWDAGVCLMHVEDGRLICGPAVVEAWEEYERGAHEESGGSGDRIGGHHTQFGSEIRNISPESER